jgi:hypothetical protein
VVRTLTFGRGSRFALDGSPLLDRVQAWLPAGRWLAFRSLASYRIALAAAPRLASPSACAAFSCSGISVLAASLAPHVFQESCLVEWQIDKTRQATPLHETLNVHGCSVSLFAG